MLRQQVLHKENPRFRAVRYLVGLEGEKPTNEIPFCLGAEHQQSLIDLFTLGTDELNFQISKLRDVNVQMGVTT